MKVQKAQGKRRQKVTVKMRKKAGSPWGLSR